MADRTFLTGLMLIVVVGAVLSFVLGGMASLNFILTAVIALLAVVVLLSFRSVATSHTLFLLFFIAGLLYVVLSYIDGDRTLVLLVVAIATGIGFLATAAGRPKRISAAKVVKSAVVSVPKQKTASRKPAKRKTPVRKRRVRAKKKR